VSQLSLFDADEYYRFPEELLEYTGNFLPEAAASRLEEKLLKNTPWNQPTQKMYGLVW
jgi:hypothetical protein